MAQTDRASLPRSPGPESWGQLTFQEGLRDPPAATEAHGGAAIAEASRVWPRLSAILIAAEVAVAAVVVQWL